MQKLETHTSLFIYLHTHWDREWFLTFSTAQALLMDRVRKTLAALEADQLPNFYLDGQAVVLEDVLAIEPQLEGRLRRTMERGQLSAGPWYVLPDQSLVGGESLVRNLKVGIEITRTFGTPVMTGYNPDTFCHIQDLPRILNGFAINTALVLRGVPPLKDTNVFWWASPDGSRVLTYWLNKGLSHSIFHKSDKADEIASDLKARWELDTADSTKAPMLFSAGGEGMQPPGDLMVKVEKLNRILPQSCQAEVVSMEQFLSYLEKWAANKDLPEIVGDLRDNRSISEKFPAYVLDGVSSTRLYLKRDNVLAEHRLVRMAEPFFAMLHALDVMPYPQGELLHVWKQLLKNHPHDSICGCSIDPVHQEMVTRTQQINSFLDGLDFLAMEKLTEWPGCSGQNGHAKIDSIALPTIAGPQPIDPDNGSDRLLTFNTSSYKHRAPVRLSWYCPPEAKIALTANEFQIEKDVLDSNHLFHSGGGFYYKPIRCIEGWLWPEEVPALGCGETLWSPLAPKKEAPGRKSIDQSGGSESVADSRCMQVKNQWKIENGLLTVEIDGQGNLIVNTALSGREKKFNLVHEFVDVGDGGDSYNFDPLPNDVPIKSKLIDIKAGLEGPLVSSLMISYAIDIPAGLETNSAAPEPLDKKRTSRVISHGIRTEISLRKGVPILFFETNFDNQAHDHRLEVRFGSTDVVKESWSECHFSLAKQPNIVEKPKLPVPVGHEVWPESYFCQRFFAAAGQLFFNSGLPEYRTASDHVAITLVRATSYLSRGRLRTRGGGAGPWLEIPEANCLGINRCSYGWAPLTEPAAHADSLDNESLDNDQITRAYQLTDLFEGRLIACPVGKFEKVQQRSLVVIANPALYSTATYVEEGKLYVRILNTTCSEQESAIKISLPVSSIGRVNLLGEDLQLLPVKKDASGATTVDLKFGTNELLTVVFTLDGAD